MMNKTNNSSLSRLDRDTKTNKTSKINMLYDSDDLIDKFLDSQFFGVVKVVFIGYIIFKGSKLFWKELGELAVNIRKTSTAIVG